MVNSSLMDEKTLLVMEYDKVLARLASHCAFSASTEAAFSLRPSGDFESAQRMQAETREARKWLSASPGMGVGGARDIREEADAAARGGGLLPGDFLDIKSTLISARNLGRLLERGADQLSHLAAIGEEFPPPTGLVDAITRTISDRGEVLDSASPRLATIRVDLRRTHERLLDRLQRMVSSPQIAPYLQDNLVTQRDGRYVIPLRADFKGKIKAVVHDQSASGATLFVEPLAVVDLNNQYRELQLAERDEERRVLAELSAQVGDFRDELVRVVEILAAIDLIFAKAKYADQLDASEPGLSPFSPPAAPRGSGTAAGGPEAEAGAALPGGRQPGGEVRPGIGCVIRLKQARHPLLNPDAVVPIDVELDPGVFAMVITGPNTGGKTVTLKTVGLLVLMAQSGMAIPARAGSELSVFESVFADIGDEQSIEQSLSTFSGHITTIIRLLGSAGPQSLVILDELGAGTDPQEGAALAQAILEHLISRRITTLVATHYPELKTYAHASPGVVNASLEFDLETLSPTYHLVVGLPGRSNALAIARRLGLDESILERAAARLSPTDLQVDDLLDEIHRQRDLVREARLEADQARQEAEGLRDELKDRLEKIEDERRVILDQAREEAGASLEHVQAELREARRLLAQARQPLEAIEPLQTQLDELSIELEAPVTRRQPPVPESLSREPEQIRLGDRVRLRTLGTVGVVGALGEDEAEVHVGNLRVRTRLVDLELQPAGEEAPAAGSKTGRVSVTASGGERVLATASPGLELNLRGRRLEEALDLLESYLDAAFLAGLPYARIIHGKGTGKLREAVRNALRGHPHVATIEPGAPNEGGEGVTVVRFLT